MWPGPMLAVLSIVTLVTSIVPAQAETVRVTIDQLVFSPAEVHARVGDTIEWINRDDLAHTATVQGDWDVMIPPKKTASFVLKKPGNVAYSCRFHPNMTGRISIEPK